MAILSFLRCSKRVKLAKSDIPLPSTVPSALPSPPSVDTEDIQVKTIIDPSDLLEPVATVLEPVEPVARITAIMETLPGQAENLVDTVPAVQEPPVEPPVEVQEVKQVQKKKTSRALYNHKYWPSPRAVNFVRYLRSVKAEGLSYEGRLTHEKALNILASYGSMTVDELLNMNPVEYLESKMYNFAVCSFPIRKDGFAPPLGWQTWRRLVTQ